MRAQPESRITIAVTCKVKTKSVNQTNNPTQGMKDLNFEGIQGFVY